MAIWIQLATSVLTQWRAGASDWRRRAMRGSKHSRYGSRARARVRAQARAWAEGVVERVTELPERYSLTRRLGELRAAALSFSILAAIPVGSAGMLALSWSALVNGAAFG